MSSPLDNSNSSNNIRQPQSFAIGQTPQAITEEEKKSTKDIGDIKEMEIIPFAVSTAVHRNELISSSTSRSNLTSSVPPGTQPTETTLTAMTQNASIQPNIYVPPAHLRELRNLFQSLCTHGLATKERIEIINNNAIGMANIAPIRSGDIKPSSKIHLNYVYSQGGILTSLVHWAKGGLSVALEREVDHLRHADLTSEAAKSELSERAHQTIIVGILHHREPDDRGNFGRASLIVIKNEGGQSLVDEEAGLGRKMEDGSNETTNARTILPVNFSFIIIPKRLSSLVQNIQAPCEHVYAVESDDLQVYLYGRPATISCPDYLNKLNEIYEEHETNMLTHVMRCVTEQDIKKSQQNRG